MLKYLDKIKLMSETASNGLECTNMVLSKEPGYYSLIIVSITSYHFCPAKLTALICSAIFRCLSRTVTIPVEISANGSKRTITHRFQSWLFQQTQWQIKSKTLPAQGSMTTLPNRSNTTNWGRWWWDFSSPVAHSCFCETALAQNNSRPSLLAARDFPQVFTCPGHLHTWHYCYSNSMSLF